MVKNTDKKQIVCADDAFMADLFAGLDNDLFDRFPSSSPNLPPSSPKKVRKFSDLTSGREQSNRTNNTGTIGRRIDQNETKVLTSTPAPSNNTSPVSMTVRPSTPPPTHRQALGDVPLNSPRRKGVQSSPKRKHTDDSFVKNKKPRLSLPQDDSLPVNVEQLTPKMHVIDVDELLGDAEEWDDFGISPIKPSKAGALSPVKTKTKTFIQSHLSVPPPPSYTKDEPYLRLRVIEVKAVVEDFTKVIKVAHLPDRQHSKSKAAIEILSEEGMPDSIDGEILLKDDWYNTPIKKGDVIHLIAPIPSSPYLSILSIKSRTLLILHPDLLLSSTKIADSSHCTRKPVLQEKFRSNSVSSMSLLMGNLGHEVIQRCLEAEQWDESFANTTCEEICRKHINTLWSMDVSLEKVISELRMQIGKAAIEFGNKFIVGHQGKFIDQRSTVDESLQIERVCDIEEDIWSSKWGLKGKIDASVQANIEGKNKIFPLEIKTGKSEAGLEHRAQTMLYTLLMGERYGENVESGLLYYTRSGSVHRVWAAQKEIRGLIQSRNRMAHFLHHSHEGKGEVQINDLEDCWKGILPPSVDDRRACERCYVVDSCLLYRRSIEKDLQVGKPQGEEWLQKLYNEKTGHLTDVHANFFKHWENLIALEEREGSKLRKEIWTMEPHEREKYGRCFADMVLDCGPPSTKSPASDRSRLTYHFVADPDKPPTSFISGHLARGDPIVISVDKVALALARGFILELKQDSVTVGLDRPLHTPKHLGTSPGKLRFRIDKDELSAGMGRVRDNLAQLFYSSGDEKRRHLIVDLQSPRFRNEAHPRLMLDDLNEDQQQVVKKVLNTEDYALVLGMPGTGKTTTIAKIIETLVAQGKSILLTSYTHSAVDTILAKVQHFGCNILRLGNPDKVASALKQYTISFEDPTLTLSKLDEKLMMPQVVATTCLTIDHVIFSRRQFDYCIVDEASQISLPTCLGPLRFADKFILVGDHNQLPPLVKSAEAKRNGFEISLFKRLSDAHPEAIVSLSLQYRMNSDIMEVSNKLVYDDKLRCGSKEVADRRLNLPQETNFILFHNQTHCDMEICWLKEALNPQRSVVFVDTDRIPGTENKLAGGHLIQNEIEARLICQTTDALLSAGIEPSAIGIIAMYRQQIRLLSRLLQQHKNIEILTADQSQGRDKDCILMSLTRSNPDNQVGDLLRDWRRLNVCFTRSKVKMIVFGSRTTLSAIPTFKNFFSICDQNSWILNLQKDTFLSHTFP